MAKKTPTRRPRKAPAQADSSGGIDYGLVGLGGLLRTYRLRVPKYQRDYAWDDQNVIDLLDDLAGAVEKGESRHFLGSIVLTRMGPEDLEIVDGQQRLATAFMVLCAVRDYFSDQRDATRADSVSNKYIITSDLKTKRVVPRLVLNATDDPFFSGSRR